MARVAVVPLVAATLLLAGCLADLGLGEARTEWAYAATQLDQMADLGRTGSGVRVALLDTGVNPDHPALAHLFDGDRADGEVVGFQDFVAGRSATPYDDDGHGSHVLGIIGADGSTLGDQLTYGGVDLQGGAPEAQFYVAKVCGAESVGCPDSAVLAGLKWATGQGAQVISLSLGRAGGVAALGGILGDELTNAVNAAIDRGIVVVASAGNDGPDNADVGYPANIAGVLAVGAIQKDGAVWEGSNRGDTSMACQMVPFLGNQGRCDPDKKPELVAPGVEILSAWTEGSYVKATGTSQACPFVTATVALLLQDRPALNDRADVQHLKTTLMQSAKPVGGQDKPHDAAAGYGVVQARAALDAYRPR
ncbi:MAG: S8 family serine peptidase [Candidatus Thermoplasmatota archaeon]